MGLQQIGPSTGLGGGVSENTDVAFKKLALSPDSLTGSAETSALTITQTLNTTGSPDVLLVDITNTASGANTTLANFKAGGVSQLSVGLNGSLTTPYADTKTVFLCGSGSSGFRMLSRNGHNLALHRPDNTPMAIIRFGTGGEVATGRLLLSSDGSPYNANAFLSAAAAATWQLGENHATAPVAQTLQGAGATSGNSNGGILTIRGGNPHGSGTRGTLNLLGGIVYIQSADSSFIQLDGLVVGKYITLANASSFSPSVGAIGLCEKDSEGNFVPGYWSGSSWCDMTGSPISFYSPPE